MSDYVVKERLCWNEGRDVLVPETDTRARFLAYVPGDKIPVGEAVSYGLTDPPKSKPKPRKNKLSKGPSANK